MLLILGRFTLWISWEATLFVWRSREAQERLLDFIEKEHVIMTGGTDE